LVQIDRGQGGPRQARDTKERSSPIPPRQKRDRVTGSRQAEDTEERCSPSLSRQTGDRETGSRQNGGTGSVWVTDSRQAGGTEGSPRSTSPGQIRVQGKKVTGNTRSMSPRAALSISP